MPNAPQAAMEDTSKQQSLRFSVCIISNVLNPLLHRVLESAARVSDDICLGLNGLDDEGIAAFPVAYPRIRVIKMAWKGYGPVKNELAAYTRHDWILSIDSDEVINEVLQENLLQLPGDSDKVVYAFRRYNFIGSERIRFGSYGKESLKPRLYNKNQVSWNNSKVHEVLEAPAGFIHQQVPGALLHYSAADRKALAASNTKYACLSAENKIRNGVRVLMFKMLLAPLRVFFGNYIFKLGFLDGATGFWLAKEYARYTYLKYYWTRYPERKPGSKG